MVIFLQFQVGDAVQARWVNGKYYPATVKVIDNLCMQLTHIVTADTMLSILLGDKATVQFQDNVEHTLLLKDIRAQKVCTSNELKQFNLFSCRNQISSQSGLNYNRKLRGVRIGTRPWRENQELRSELLQNLTLLVRAPSSYLFLARRLDLKTMLVK